MHVTLVIKEARVSLVLGAGRPRRKRSHAAMLGKHIALCVWVYEVHTCGKCESEGTTYTAFTTSLGLSLRAAALEASEQEGQLFVDEQVALALFGHGARGGLCATSPFF